MKCRKCGADLEDRANFCPTCGTRVVEDDVPVLTGDETFTCYKHKKEPTRLRCGKCEKPICTKCMVMSPAGIRCKDCSRHNVSVRWRGVAHDAASGIGRIDGRKVWYLYLLSMIARFFTGWFR